MTYVSVPVCEPCLGEAMQSHVRLIQVQPSSAGPWVLTYQCLGCDGVMICRVEVDG